MYIYIYICACLRIYKCVIYAGITSICYIHTHALSIYPWAHQVLITKKLPGAEEVRSCTSQQGRFHRGFQETRGVPSGKQTIAMENGHRNSIVSFPITVYNQKLWFSIVVLICQRVNEQNETYDRCLPSASPFRNMIYKWWDFPHLYVLLGWFSGGSMLGSLAPDWFTGLDWK